MKQEWIFPKIVIAGTIISSVATFFFASNIISTIFAVIILLCFFNRNVLNILKQNLSLKLLLLAAFLINIGFLYSLYTNDDYAVGQIFNSSNTLFIVLYIISASYFLSINNKYPDYLLNIFSYVVAIVSFIAFLIFCYKYYLGDYFIISELYGGGDIQFIVALTFPFSAVIIIGKATQQKRKLLKVFMICIGILIIFIDLFVNRSKTGYIIEFVIFLYYSLIIIKKCILNYEKTSKFKLLTYILFSIFTIVIIFITVDKTSKIFNDRAQEFVTEIQLYFSKNIDKQKINKISSTSTGLRLMYYNSSIKVFEKYPQVFFLGCPIITNISDIPECTNLLINNSDELKNNPYIIKDGIYPHNEFINYTFKGGILSGVLLLFFFITLFFEMDKLNNYDKFYGRVLVLAMFIGCLFYHFLTSQVLIILFSNLVSIFFAKLKIKSIIEQHK